MARLGMALAAVRIGPRAHDRRMIGAQCTVKRVLDRIGGEHRYAVETIYSGMSTIVLESTLQQIKIQWSECPFRPKRAMR